MLVPDEGAHSVVVWDIRTGEVLQRLSGHTNVVSWVASSPVEPALMTCSNDHRARFWFDDHAQ